MKHCADFFALDWGREHKWFGDEGKLWEFCEHKNVTIAPFARTYTVQKVLLFRLIPELFFVMAGAKLVYGDVTFVSKNANSNKYFIYNLHR